MDISAVDVLKGNFRRRVKNGTLSLSDLETICSQAEAAVLSNTTITEVDIEGGATRSVVSVPPQVVYAAASAVLSDLDPNNPLGGVDNSQRYADFSNGRIQT